MSAVLPHLEITPRRPHWLADDAVLIGPVSVSNSLLAGNLTGNFAFLALSCDFGGESAGKFNSLRSNSLKPEQGIFWGEQGILSPEQRILSAEQRNSPSASNDFGAAGRHRSHGP
jgi:hypothetical protein